MQNNKVWIRLISICLFFLVYQNASAQCNGPNVTGYSINTYCNGSCEGYIDIIVTDGTEPYSYQWIDGSTNEDISNACAGTYCVTVTDADNCTAESCFDVWEPNEIWVDLEIINQPGSGQANGEIAAQVNGGSGPYTYEWTTGESTSLATGLPEGFYCLVVFDQNGCYAENCLDLVSVDLTLVLDGPTQLCIGECGIYTGLDAGGGNICEFTWAGPQGQSSNNPDFEMCPTDEGIITIYLEAADCSGNFEFLSFDVEVISTIPLEVVSTSAASCPDNNSTSACEKTCANSTVTYTVPNSQNMDLEWEVLGAENYVVDDNIVTVTWGNPGTGEVNVTSDAPPTVTGGACGPLKLNGIQRRTGPSGIGQVHVGAGTPPYTYLWSGSAMTGSSISNLDPGTYIVTVTDANGITDVCEVVIEDPTPGCNNPFSISTINIDHPNCNTSGQIDLTMVGAGYTYIWSNGSTEQNQANLFPGEYCVSITQSNICTQVECFDLCAPTPVYLNAYVSSYPSFPGENNGSAGAQAFGGAPPYQYQWIDNGGVSISNDNLAQDLTQGPYTVIVTDINGCSVTETIEITYDQDCPMAVYVQIEELPTGCNTFDGVVSLFTFDGQDPYEIIWNDGSSETFRTDISTGNYSVTVIDTFDCIRTFDFFMPCLESTIITSPPDQCMGVGSLCIDIIPEPQAAFTTNPADINGLIEICRGQSVLFQNESDNAENYVWQLGDGYATSAQDVEHVYTESGLFNVLLIARNECFCLDTTTIKVLVSDDEIPEIECVGTVCENETVTYSSTVDCSIFNWTVSPNGSITDGGGNTDDYVTINWGAGPVGLVTLQVSGCSGNICASPTTVSVPIIMDGILIEGPAKVCPGEIGTYSIPQWSGTEYLWSASPFGEIKSGQGSSTVNIKWNVEMAVSEQQWVHVEYNNCYLECGGESTKDVDITPDFYLAGPIDACASSSSEYMALDELTNSPVLCNWAVLYADSTVYWNSPGSASTANINWPDTPGKYILQATAVNVDDFCTDVYTIFVGVLSGPPPVNGINGQNTICPGEFYTYEAQSTAASVAFNWTINNGGTLTEATGDAINVQWGANPPYELSITQTSTAGLPCVSDPITMVINTISNVTLSGPTSTCIENIEAYTSPPIGNAVYDWAVIPPSAGTILSGQGGELIEVIWHEAGDATVSVGVCGANETRDVTVFGYPEPEVMHPDSLCANETASVSVTTAFSSYSWQDEDGTQISTSNSPNLSPGFYELVVTNSAGCEGQTTFRINGLPVPVISISTPGLKFFCLAAGFPIPTLYALNTDEGYTFEWYQNGIPLGVFVDNYTPTGAGSFYVVVNDANGCSSISNTIVVYESCGSGGGGGPPAPGVGCDNVDFTSTNGPTCLHGIFENISTNYVPGSVSWNFDDPASGAANTSNLENPEHFFSSAGFYNIKMAVTMQTGGVCIIAKPFEIPAQANFNVVSTCPGLPVEFEDLSTFTPGTTITDYDWDFGDPTSAADNNSALQNPTHIYENIGTYNITLTVTTQTGCTSTRVKTVSILPPPVASFPQPDIACQATAVAFNMDLNPGITSFEWNFDDPGSGAANTSRLSNTFHAFSDAGIFDVELMVFNVYGCSDSMSLPVTIEPNGLTGIIDMLPGSPICEGDTTNITAPPGAVSWEWSDGSTTESISSATTGTFDVTITDNLGCTYAPPTAALDIVPEPDGTIKVTEYNEFGQPVDCFFNGYILCEGEDVFLNIIGADGYSYIWSTGQTGDELIFDEDHGGTLSAGEYEYSVTVTDTGTGCTSIEGPYSITVNPVPTDIMIISSPAGPVCEQTATAFTISNPDPQLSYTWSTGEIGMTIIASTAGEYFVRGVSSFGCEGESNHIEIFAAPDTRFVPDGCHTRCNPDTVCLPNIPGVVDYQWYFNEVAIPAPEGTTGDYIPTESGSYTVELFDINGCNALSGPFQLDLLPLDTNAIILDACEGGTVEYDGVILLPGTTTEFVFSNFTGCDSTVTVTVLEHPNYEENVELSACDGADVIFEGISYPSDTTVMLNYMTQFGCDSIIQLNIESFPTSSENLTFETCTGVNIIYEGEELEPGSTTTFNLTNSFSCDSIVTVSVLENPSYEDTVSLSGCNGAMVNFQGIDYSVGTNEVFTYSTFAGCDSIVYLNITELLSYSDTVNFETCAGSEIVLPGGIILEAGADTTLFLFTEAGCDSTLQVYVEEVSGFEINVDLEACTGSSASFEGTDYPPGTDLEFNYLSQEGCDSVVYLTVAQLPIQSESLQLFACSGTTVEYAGEDLAPGSVTTFDFTNQFNCDSIVVVTVLENNNYYEEFDLEGCEGGSVVFDGTSYPVGTLQQLNYTTVAGCDSTIVLNISGLPLGEENVTLSACEGGTVEYVGDDLPAGSTTTYIFPNQFGCDSMVLVTVLEVPVQNETINLMACNGDSIIFGGVSYAVGTQTVLNYTNQGGCDSIINLNIAALPSYQVPLVLEGCLGETVEYEGSDLEVGSTTIFEYSTQDGCDSNVIVAVVAYPDFSFELFPSDLICWNSEEGELNGYLSGSTGPYTYSLDGLLYQDTFAWTNLSGGDYTVYVQDTSGCIREDAINIPVIPPLDIAFNASDISCEADSVIIQSALLNGLTDSMTYQWQHGFIGPVAPAYDPGVYTLELSNLCETQNFEIVVELEDGARENFIYIPNAFSPNGDGVNDIFKAYPAEGVELISYELHLYDRWGNTLYSTTNIDEGWNGVFLNEGMNPGVYVWWLRAKVLSCRNEIDLFEKGDVTIMK